MISKDFVNSLIQDELENSDIFIVDLTIDKLNKINVVIDSFNGVTIDECSSLSKAIKRRLDNNLEDFALEVSSPGLDRPFKLPIQYKKNIGREIEIIDENNNIIIGRLKLADDEKIEIETETKIQIEGKKKKILIPQTIYFKNIKSAKVKIIY